MERAVIGMGTNLGDLEGNLLFAAGWIDEADGLHLVGLSPVYRTEPVGSAIHPFLNAAALVETVLDPGELLARLQVCELLAGRPADHEKWGPRVLDLDVLVMGERVRDAGPPVLPHPGLLERDFALRPLLDLAPGTIHPGTGQSLAAALDELGHATILSGPHPLPMEIGYRMLEHTADAGIEVEAADVHGLLSAAAMSLADAIVPRQKLQENERVDVVIEAADIRTALVDLLQEVIFHLETRGFLPVRVRARLAGEGDDALIRATLFGSRVDPSWVRLPVKAATHHDLVVEQGGHGWRARVYVDV